MKIFPFVVCLDMEPWRYKHLNISSTRQALEMNTESKNICEINAESQKVEFLAYFYTSLLLTKI